MIHFCVPGGEPFSRGERVNNMSGGGFFLRNSTSLADVGKIAPHGEFWPVNFRRGDFLAFPVITGASVTTQLFLFAQSLVLQCVLRRKTGWHTTGRQVIFTGRTANSN